MHDGLGVGLRVLTVDDHKIQPVQAENLTVHCRAGGHERAKRVAVLRDFFPDKVSHFHGQSSFPALWNAAARAAVSVQARTSAVLSWGSVRSGTSRPPASQSMSNSAFSQALYSSQLEERLGDMMSIW